MEQALRAALQQAVTRIETRLGAVLSLSDAPLRLAEACRHAALGGGKRLRGFLVLESSRLTGADPAAALEAAVAVELIHAYSLVHDDLPSMDDDDLRRGKPTVHVAWDEATAILVGDGLQALAFETVGSISTAPAERVLTLSRTLAAASGMAGGMVGGQMLDIEAESRPHPAKDPMADIAAIQSAKTGALFHWSALAGPRLAGARTEPLAAFATALGQAFQVQDDILDVTGDAEIIGKAVNKDDVAGKATYVSLLGLEGARQEAARLADTAIKALDPYGSDGQTLAALARYTVDRSH